MEESSAAHWARKHEEYTAEALYEAELQAALKHLEALVRDLPDTFFQGRRYCGVCEWYLDDGFEEPNHAQDCSWALAKDFLKQTRGTE